MITHTHRTTHEISEPAPPNVASRTRAAEPSRSSLHVIALTGELDLATADELEQELLRVDRAVSGS